MEAQAETNYDRTISSLTDYANATVTVMRLSRNTTAYTSPTSTKPQVIFEEKDYVFPADTPLNETAWILPQTQTHLPLEFYEMQKLYPVSSSSIGPSDVFLFENVARTSVHNKGKLSLLDRPVFANFISLNEDRDRGLECVVLKLHTAFAMCNSRGIKHVHTMSNLGILTSVTHDVVLLCTIASAWANGMSTLHIHRGGDNDMITQLLSAAKTPVDLVRNMFTLDGALVSDVYNNLMQEAYLLRFMAVADVGDVDLGKSILSTRGFDPSAEESRLLKDLVHSGNAPFVRLLVEDGRSDPNATSAWSDDSALSIALKNNNPDVLRELLRDPKLKLRGIRAAALAVEGGSPDILRMLLDDPRSDPSEDANEALEIAAQVGDVEMFKMLLDDERSHPLTNRDVLLEHAASDEIVKLINSIV